MAEQQGIRFRPQMFPIDFDLGDANGRCLPGIFAEGSIGLNDRIFILQMITWVQSADLSYVGSDIGVGQAAWAHDGLFSIDWSVYNSTRFWKGSIPIARQLGSPDHGVWVPLKAPVALPGNETLSVKLTNRVARILGFSVQVCFHGIERTDRSYSAELAAEQKAA